MNRTVHESNVMGRRTVGRHFCGVIGVSQKGVHCKVTRAEEGQGEVHV